MIDVSCFTLDNGLRVVHNYEPGTAMAVLGVLYDVGARDESPGLTGLAHLSEHLMFGGTHRVPAFDKALERAGGTNNAATGNDFTFFYDQVPVQNIETPFCLESDRMLGLAFSPRSLEVQRSVVVEEFKQTCLNQPYGRTMHELRPLLYGAHPYSWPVIGKDPSHIEAVTLDDARRWHAAHYGPNNAILAVCGNISPERVRELAGKWFGPVPARPAPPRLYTDTPWLLEPALAEVTDRVSQTALVMAYRMPPYGEKGYLEADAITDILSAGKSARLLQRLVLGTDLFSQVDASISGSEHSGFVMVHAMLCRGDSDSVARAQDMIRAELVQLAEPGNISEYELERARNRYEAMFTFDNMNLVERARNIAGAAIHGEDINSYVPRYRALTLGDIAGAARRIFVEHAPATVITRPA